MDAEKMRQANALIVEVVAHFQPPAHELLVPGTEEYRFAFALCCSGEAVEVVIASIKRRRKFENYYRTLKERLANPLDNEDDRLNAETVKGDPIDRNVKVLDDARELRQVEAEAAARRGSEPA